ncbi:MAG: hypothetical protein AAFX99_35085, partial [Myxococcota bacterium]
MSNPFTQPPTRQTTTEPQGSVDTQRMQSVVTRLADAVFFVDCTGQVNHLSVHNTHTPETWRSAQGRLVWELFFASESPKAISMEMNLEQLFDDFMPEELTLCQFPERIVTDSRYFRATYHLTRDMDEPKELMVILNDITDHLEEE